MAARFLSAHDKYIIFWENPIIFLVYSNIDNAALNTEVIQLKRIHPHDGEVLMVGHLAPIGIQVTRARLRASIHGVDPDGIVARGRCIIK